MKKFLLSLLGTLILSVSVNAQVFFSDDFPYSDDPNYDYDAYLDQQGWMRYSPVYESADYYYRWHIGVYSGGQEAYLRASSYDNQTQTNHETEQWAITPAIDLSNATSVYLKFDNRKRYQPYAPLTVWITTDAVTDSASFIAANWTELTGLTLDDNDGDYDWATDSSDISSYAGQTIHIAFKYVSTASAGGVWDVDNVKVGVPSTPSMTQAVEPTVIYPNPVSDVLYVMTGANSNIFFYNALGQKVLSAENVDQSVNVAELPAGIYTVRIEAQGKVYTRKLIKK